ncbi:ABC transporter substrate-binding protein [Amycolatopsis pithecellobii]|uniref:Twin-arginine translocation signal domain-containing protein n=1 Tax=Amycolatopsis pithecellobii TaxID=664692 RepID=A0A6N7YQY0_9PSEU|nr:ABC transporter substrate-binding protein [Amycolatopsis pithecellobii]MTD54392.1 twin-arginine translocation signal domain-containing protein [Amycolatopsis pithecellobii]
MDRRDFLKGLGLTVTASGLGALLAACNANEQQSGQAIAVSSGGTLYVLYDLTSQRLDPAKSSSLAITMSGLIHRRLTAWQTPANGPATVVPDLATDIGRASADGRTWTYTLKDGLKLSDGTPITSAEIKYGIERSFDAAFSGGLGYHKTLLDGGSTYRGPFSGGELASIETPDPKTIVFHLARSYGDWPWIVSMPAFAPVPKGKGTDANYDSGPVTSGPYQVASYTKGVEIRLTRNPNWDPHTDLARTGLPDTIVVQLGQDTGVTAQRLLASAGNDAYAFGAAFVNPAQLAQIRTNPAAKNQLVTSKSGALAYLALNTRRGPLANVKVRQAFQYAVDKTAYQIATAGNAELAGPVATTLITEGITGREVFDLYPAPPGGDVAKARQLLAEAGYPNGIENLDFPVSTANNKADLAQAIQAALQRAGIQAKLRPLDDDAWTAIATGNDDNAYDLTLSTWQPDFPSANANIQPLFGTSEIGNGGYNLSRYSVSEVDTLIAQAQGTVDPAAAGKLWAAADRRILQDSPIVPLIYTRNSFLHGAKVGDFAIGEFPAYPNFLQVGLAK